MPKYPYVKGVGPMHCPVMLVGEAPRPPFDDDAGEVLTMLLAKFGIFRSQVYITNLVKYWTGPGNPDPELTDIKRDEPQLLLALKLHKPILVIGLGRISTQWLMGLPDSRFDFELTQGIIHRSERFGFFVAGVVHPAAGLHDPNWAARTYWNIRNLAEPIKRALNTRDLATLDEFAWEERRPQFQVKIWDVNHPIIFTGEYFVDTEGTPERPFSFQACDAKHDFVHVVPAASAHHAVFHGPIFFHNAKYDVKMLKAMKVQFSSDPGMWGDSMIAAYARQDEPSQGLKQLVYRRLGRVMQSYDDVVRPHYNKLALEALETLSIIKFERPDPILIETPKGLQWKTPQALHNRAKSILRSHSKDPLLDIEARWLKIEPTQRELAKDYGVEIPSKSIHLVPPRLAYEYGAEDAHATKELFADYVATMDPALDQTYVRDVAIIPTLIEMEDNGMPFDCNVAEQLHTIFTDEANGYRDKLRSIVGDPVFNPGSIPQVSKWLFDKMGVSSPRKTKLTGNDSSDDRALSTLKLQFAGARTKRDHAIYAFVSYLIEYRECRKLDSTYVHPDALPSLVKNGRIHPTLKNTRVASGRLSSENPNLQNIPTRSTRGKLIRGCFVAPKGHLLLSVDLGQIELRIAAHESQDKRMIASFLGGDDMHRITEREIFGVPDSEAGKLRISAKAFNFRVLYAGPEGSPKGLQEQLFLDGITLSKDECQAYRDQWFDLYPGVKKYLAKKAWETRRNDYITTPGGRRRYLPFANLDAVKRAQAEANRQAGNHPIQGGAQEVIKGAMIRWDAEYRALTNNFGPSCKLLMQIHDELMFEVPVDVPGTANLHSQASLLVDMMTKDTNKYKVPIVADAKIGPSWAKQEKMKL